MSQHLSTCPSCREQTLQHAELTPQLPCFRCLKCNGQWVRGEDYRRWLQHPDRAMGQAQQTTASLAEAALHPDSQRAMRCPECGKILTRYRVGHGVPFMIDRCAACGGVWLDASEWEILRQHQLEDRIHLVFSTAWQAQILRDEQQGAADEQLRSRIGGERFAELKRTLDWLDQSPHRAQVLAYLIEHLRERETRAAPA